MVSNQLSSPPYMTGNSENRLRVQKKLETEKKRKRQRREREREREHSLRRQTYFTSLSCKISFDWLLSGRGPLVAAALSLG